MTTSIARGTTPTGSRVRAQNLTAERTPKAGLSPVDSRTQVGGLIVFAIGVVVIIGAFTAYLVVYGRWVGGRWSKRATRDSDKGQ
jgi:hypothetical protein